jgi:hypothetical protein
LLKDGHHGWRTRYLSYERVAAVQSPAKQMGDAVWLSGRPRVSKASAGIHADGGRQRFFNAAPGDIAGTVAI